MAKQNEFRLALFALAAAIAAATGGCSSNGASFPSLPELTGSFSEAPIVGSPTEVYERIARGALTCWFGVSGPLKADYVYHAEADPPGKGGNAEIIIHERDRLSSNPKGVRAYRIAITPDKESTTLLFENFKIPEARAMSLEADARRWGAGAIGCAGTQSEGWSESAPAPSPPAEEGKKKRSSKNN
jgi:hypothetical protein